MDAEAAEAFARLRAVCPRLLERQGSSGGEVAADPAQLRAALRDLETASGACTDNGLQACMEYALFPLLLLLSQHTQQSHASQSTLEPLLNCLSAILSRCQCRTQDQLLTLIMRLVPVLMGDRGKMSEEARLRAVASLAAVVGGAREDTVDVLREEKQAPALGHLLSLLVQIAQQEVQAGDTGSRSLATSAINLLHAIITRVADADALAFFLPGTVSGLTKLLLSATQPSSSRAAGGETGTACLRALSAILSTVLADANSDQAERGDGPLTAVSALSALYKMASIANTPTAPAIQAPQREVPASSNASRRLRVVRHDAWMRETAERVQELFGKVLKPLAGHPAISVRAALAQVLVRLWTECERSLSCCTELFLDGLLVLSLDSYTQVSNTAVAFLSTVRAAEPASNMRVVLARIMQREVESLSMGSGGGMRLRMLAGVMLATGPEEASYYATTGFVNAIVHMFAMEASTGKHITERAATRVTGTSSTTLQDIIQLPRMPTNMSVINTDEAYQQAALACRLAGRYCALAEGRGQEGAPLMSLVSSLCSIVRGDAIDEDVTNNSNVHHLLRAGSAAAVLNEVLYGASSTWNPSLTLSWTQDSVAVNILGGDIFNHAPALNLMPHALVVAQEYLSPVLWTDSTTSVVDDSTISRVRAQVQQVLLEGLGVNAVALGERGKTDARWLSLTLFPILDKLGSANMSISECAAVTLAAVSSGLGYGDPGALVAANADYVVDGLCKGLANLPAHPHTPQLFLAVLRRTGAGTRLLPLLEEPLAAVLRALTVVGRARTHPAHVHAFTCVLKELAVAAKVEGEELVGVALRAAERAKQEFEAFAQAAASAANDVEDIDSDDEINNNDETDDDMPTTSEGVRSYFLHRARAKHDRHQPCTQPLTFAEREQLRNRVDGVRQALEHRRRDAVRSVAFACVEAATPLLGSDSVHTRVAALDVLEHGLDALARVKEAAEADNSAERVMEDARRALGENLASDPPVQPSATRLGAPSAPPSSTPKQQTLLPAIHLVWPHFVTGLRHPRRPVLLRTLEVLASMAVCDGQFIARRVRDDMWPEMRRLLVYGPASASDARARTSSTLLEAGGAADRAQPPSSLLIVPDVDPDGPLMLRAQSPGANLWGHDRYQNVDDRSPASVAKVRKGVLTCVATIASSDVGFPALRLVLNDITAHVLPFLSKRHLPQLQTAAQKALHAMATRDGAVREHLEMLVQETDTAHQRPSSGSAAVKGSLIKRPAGDAAGSVVATSECREGAAAMLALLDGGTA